MFLGFLVLFSLIGSIYASDMENGSGSLGVGSGKTLQKPRVYEDESDEEGSVYDREAFGSKHPNVFSSSIVDIGMRVKLIANVYLRNLDEKANIFVPFFRATIKNPDGSLVERVNYFRYKGRKGKICVFASGGFHNAWEKSTQRVYEAFYGSKIKIIRGTWIQKHLYRDYKELQKFERTPLEDLHSELYYKTFFERFFPRQLEELKEGGDVLGVVIDAFSWWDVCDGCHEHNLPHNLGKTPVTYRIKSARPYTHTYRDTDMFQSRVLSDLEEKENKHWLSLWSEIKKLPEKDFSDEEDKRKYWTETIQGIELTKWLGQAFVENKKPGKKGDVLRHYQALEEFDRDQLKGLIDYLKEENWEFSCWYSHPFPRGDIQKKWKKYWLQLVVPHFGWKEISSEHLDQDTNCEMCGFEEARKISYIYHPKYRSAKGFPQSKVVVAFLGGPLPPESDELKKFKVKSLAVGSKCIETLRLTKEELVKPMEVAAEQAERDKSYDDLDAAEKELKKQAAEKRKEEARIKKVMAEKKKQERLLRRQTEERKRESKKQTRKTPAVAVTEKVEPITAPNSYRTPERKNAKKRVAEADEVETDTDSSGYEDDRERTGKNLSKKRLTNRRIISDDSDGD